MPRPKSPIKIEVKSDPVIERLNAIKKAGKDLAAPLNSIGDLMRSSVEKNFEVGGRYSQAGSWRGGNNRWQVHSEVTKEIYHKRGKKEPFRILDASQGGLASSITKQVKGNNLTLGTNKPYGAIHQFGGLAGRKTARVTIPARPFLVVQDEDVNDMTDILDKHIKK